eukprot:CAMPEP_0196591800 /NCGR_PEP_ID=MMETSP1081-20130531/70915_1 /TAXON_ID=36882 /ORGANISM="Pyramimonas amylifera, Strain CCMP720" /LENGTH=41 /DNA_ID= /DNA_START= /DNA_END= /DNA_ORIENTATION=
MKAGTPLADGVTNTQHACRGGSPPAPEASSATTSSASNSIA